MDTLVLVLCGVTWLSCNLASRQLIESSKAWLDNVKAWEGSFCSSLQLTQTWLRAQAIYDAALQQDVRDPVDVLAEQQALDPRVFSRFKTTIDCGSSRGKKSEQVTWIEPLAHGLRHPNSLCDRGTTVFNRTYLMPAHSNQVNSRRNSSRSTCAGRACQAIYTDLGATLLQQGPAEPGQGWFFHTYAKQGITFDRYLLWESQPRRPADIFRNVPRHELEKYTYYNIPVTADTQDAAHPVRILKVRSIEGRS